MDRDRDDRVMKPEEVARELGVSLRTLQRMKLPKVRRGAGRARTGYLASTVRAVAARRKD